jgi:MFS transporter, DHA2 family, integral membrane protein
LIASRALMGFGGAAIMPSTLLSNVFSGKERAKAIAVWAAVAGLAVAIGPLIGGYLLQRFWWGSVFLVNVPVSLLRSWPPGSWFQNHAMPECRAWTWWAPPCPSRA